MNNARDRLTDTERKLLSMGDDLRLFLPFKPTKVMVGETFFKRGYLIDSSYQDFESLKDENLSDWPAMKRLEAFGLVESLGSEWKGFANGQDGTEWRWRRTDAGRKAAATPTAETPTERT